MILLMLLHWEIKLQSRCDGILYSYANTGGFMKYMYMQALLEATLSVMDIKIPVNRGLS